MVLFQIDILQKTTKIYEDDKRSLKQELETRGQRLQREVCDKKRMEQRMHGVVTDTQLKWEKECVSQPSCSINELNYQKLWIINCLSIHLICFSPLIFTISTQTFCLLLCRTDVLTRCRLRCKTSFGWKTRSWSSSRPSWRRPSLTVVLSLLRVRRSRSGHPGRSAPLRRDRPRPHHFLYVVLTLGSLLYAVGSYGWSKQKGLGLSDWEKLQSQWGSTMKDFVSD